MNPADEEALTLYRTILEAESRQMQQQQRILHRASHYTVQVLTQAQRLAPK